MAFAQNGGIGQSCAELRPSDRLRLGIDCDGSDICCTSLGEAVYRFAFLDFDGATDRLPIEISFGLVFPFMATKLVRKVHEHRMEMSARITLIRDPNFKIRRAVEAIKPVPHPSSQQAIRVIREEVDRIELALREIISR